MQNQIMTQCLLCVAIGLTCSISRADEPLPIEETDRIDAPAVLRVPLKSTRPTFRAKIDRVNDDGTVQVSQPPDLRQPPVELRVDLTEGLYLGVAQKSYEKIGPGTRFLRVIVVDVGENGAAQLRVGPTAAKAIEPGEYITLCRPAGATTARLKQLPDLAPLTKGESRWPNSEAEYRYFRSISLNNLKALGLALHFYHDTYKSFPPAVVAGPDGKRWHSWRVLLLPFLDQQNLYGRYKWDEPWDGANNSQLLSEIPSVYVDPIYDDNKEHLTHYTAITGTGTAFAAAPARFDGKQLDPAKLRGRGIRDFKDSTSNSALIGPISPDRKIPWTKPEDVEIDQLLPPKKAMESFAFPYPSAKGDAGPFAIADGSVTMIYRRADPAVFLAMLTIAGGEAADGSELTGAELSPIDSSPMLIISRVENANKPTARLVAPPQR